MTTITRHQLTQYQRYNIPATLFGAHFIIVERSIFNFASIISDNYDGGYWEMYTLSNSGFYMSPSSDTPFRVSCENGYQGELTADAFGITVALYVYSSLSFVDGEFAQICAQQYHWVRQFMLQHREVQAILGAID